MGKGGTGRLILRAGLAAAVVDGIYASVMGIIRGGGVMRVWQSVAGGWLGPVAGQGGWATAALGLATHIGIALAMAAFFIMAWRRLALVRHNIWPAALVYGFGLYAVMYLLVLPLRWPGVFPRWDGWVSVTDIAAHIAAALAIAMICAGEQQRAKGGAIA